MPPLKFFFFINLFPISNILYSVILKGDILQRDAVLDCAIYIPMAQYVVPDPNDTWQCPFEESHTIRALGAQKHLLKCQKSHPNVEIKSCPFNGTHWVRTSEMSRHMALCPDKARYHQVAMQEQHTKPPVAPVEPDDFNANFSGEVWEDDPNQKVFDWNKDVSSSASLSMQHNTLPPQPVPVPAVPQRVVKPRRPNANFTLHPTRPRQQAQPVEPPARQVEPQDRQMHGVNSNGATDTLIQINRGRARGDSYYLWIFFLDTFSPLARVVKEGSPQQAPAKHVMQGFGRGKPLATAAAPLPAVGRGRSQRMAAAIPGMKSTPAAPTRATAPPGFNFRALETALPQEYPVPCRNGSSSSLDDTDPTQADLEKQVRRISKKLTQIEVLEAQRDAGKALNADEILKIDSKQQLTNAKRTYEERIQQMT
ncbi:hypothetical protein CAPTEDRAFT_227390 [Capitella teleta]|uniref:CHHC U11-48K-type domain-containing protein n=1 Tax=Capitella teleta TaxID=283909 RepID=R7TE86_CAPTE|nr:hypothetical protein CAPTEDRAFT_227390 [Capitella teleta]|eukprot:ELT92078.1 hypothetical protein CAPTEDRAFT_227390 [Capitella teleta]